MLYKKGVGGGGGGGAVYYIIVHSTTPTYPLLLWSPPTPPTPYCYELWAMSYELWAMAVYWWDERWMAADCWLLTAECWPRTGENTIIVPNSTSTKHKYIILLISLSWYHAWWSYVEDHDQHTYVWYITTYAEYRLPLVVGSSKKVVVVATRILNKQVVEVL